MSDHFLAEGMDQESDDEVDDLTRDIHRELLEMMKRNPESVDRAMSLISISKYLERMADHATNIAEQVVFTVKGLDIRHSGKPKSIPE
jgi:phosphate transport system protein